jgi:hypothetical protein
MKRTWASPAYPRRKSLFPDEFHYTFDRSGGDRALTPSHQPTVRFDDHFLPTPLSLCLQEYLCSLQEFALLPGPSRFFPCSRAFLLLMERAKVHAFFLQNSSASSFHLLTRSGATPEKCSPAGLDFAPRYARHALPRFFSR